MVYGVFSFEFPYPFWSLFSAYPLSQHNGCPHLANLHRYKSVDITTNNPCQIL